MPRITAKKKTMPKEKGLTLDTLTLDASTATFKIHSWSMPERSADATALIVTYFCGPAVLC